MGCILKGGGGLYSRLVVGAVLLAAGQSARFGGRPKGLLELGGVPLVRRQLIALSGAGVDELVVVLGPASERLEAAVSAFPITLARNPNPADGQAASMRIGLAALGGKLDAVIVALVDQPLLHTQDISDLIGAFKKRPAGTELVVPTVGDAPGNPIVFSAAVRDEILAGSADAGCRRWRAENPDRVLRWSTDNRRYVTDVDTPEDLERFERETGHALRWPAGLEVPAAA
jgi:molybdenum cofactor cytidylyltransferase